MDTDTDMDMDSDRDRDRDSDSDSDSDSYSDRDTPLSFGEPQLNRLPASPVIRVRVRAEIRA